MQESQSILHFARLPLQRHVEQLIELALKFPPKSKYFISWSRTKIDICLAQELVPELVLVDTRKHQLRCTGTTGYQKGLIEDGIQAVVDAVTVKSPDLLVLLIQQGQNHIRISLFVVPVRYGKIISPNEMHLQGPGKIPPVHPERVPQLESPGHRLQTDQEPFHCVVPVPGHDLPPLRSDKRRIVRFKVLSIDFELLSFKLDARKSDLFLAIVAHIVNRVRHRQETRIPLLQAVYMPNRAAIFTRIHSTVIHRTVHITVLAELIAICSCRPKTGNSELGSEIDT